MSRIFDALKRSETERWNGDELTAPESVAELLQAAEGRFARPVDSFPAAPTTETFVSTTISCNACETCVHGEEIN